MLMVQLKYQDGTTDITRTFHFGKPSAHEKACYTAVSAFLSYILLDHGVHPVLEFSLTSRPVRCLIVLCISKHRHYVLFLFIKVRTILCLLLHIWNFSSSITYLRLWLLRRPICKCPIWAWPFMTRHQRFLKDIIRWMEPDFSWWKKRGGGGIM